MLDLYDMERWNLALYSRNPKPYAYWASVLQTELEARFQSVAPVYFELFVVGVVLSFVSLCNPMSQAALKLRDLTDSASQVLESQA